MASYHHGNLPAVLIDAALAIAAERDLDKLSVRELTRIAGVSPAAAYRHFPSQESIQREVRNRCRDRLVEAIQPCAGRLSPSRENLPAEEDRVRRFAQRYIAWAEEHPGWYRTAFRRTLSGDDGPTGMGSAWSAVAKMVSDVLKTDSEGKGAAAQSSIHAATATLHGLALCVVDGPASAMSNSDRQAVIDTAVRTISRTVAGGRSSGRGPLAVPNALSRTGND